MEHRCAQFLSPRHSVSLKNVAQGSGSELSGELPQVLAHWIGIPAPDSCWTLQQERKLPGVSLPGAGTCLTVVPAEPLGGK